jgi:superoxide dismutase, Cu-Zn family
MMGMDSVRRAGLPAILAGLSLAALAATVAAQPFVGPSKPHQGPPKNPKTAVAVLHASPDHPKVKGVVRFIQEGNHVWVVANVSGLDKPGQYGFHLHEVGKCDPGVPGHRFESAGAHFNPTGAPHACINSPRHHAGDLGNLPVAHDGLGIVEEATETLAFSGPLSIVGRAVVLHAGPDDCASQPAGNSGPRIACGVVELSSPIAPQPTHRLSHG